MGHTWHMVQEHEVEAFARRHHPPCRTCLFFHLLDEGQGVGDCLATSEPEGVSVTHYCAAHRPREKSAIIQSLPDAA